MLRPSVPTLVPILALALLLSLGVAATAAPPAGGGATAPTTASAPAAPAAPAPDLSWLPQKDRQQSVDPSLPALDQPRVLRQVVPLSTCLVQCIEKGGDPTCCAYICHPIGEDPC